METNHSPTLTSWERLNELSDEELATELLAGRHDALVVLFDRYHKLVFGIALKIVRDPGEAEEVVQTVFFNIFRYVANFDPLRGTLKVWLMQYAYGRALHRQRHLAAHHFYNSVSLDVDDAPALTSSDGVRVVEFAHLAQELLERLSPRKRAIIELTYFEGLTAEEISGRLGLSVGVVRHDLYRGIATLRKALNKKHPPIRKEESKLTGKEALTPDAQAL